MVGRETFNLTVKAAPCGMFYHTAKVDKIKKAMFINPLDGVIRISMLYIQQENRQMWSLVEVWNNTMSRLLSPAHCCFMIHSGNTFGGYGDKQYQYYMYQKHGQADKSCSDIQLAATVPLTDVTAPTTATGEPLIVMPDIKNLEDVINKTPVKLLNVSSSTS